MGDFPVVDLTQAEILPRQAALHEAVAYFSSRKTMEMPSTILAYAKEFEGFLTQEPVGGR